MESGRARSAAVYVAGQEEHFGYNWLNEVELRVAAAGETQSRIAENYDAAESFVNCVTCFIPRQSKTIESPACTDL